MEDGEYPGEEVRVKVVEIVPDRFQDREHYVQAEIEMFTLGWKIVLDLFQDGEHY